MCVYVAAGDEDGGSETRSMRPATEGIFANILEGVGPWYAQVVEDKPTMLKLQLQRTKSAWEPSHGLEGTSAA
ncbi:hypothetical protein O1611_g1029 [Lasiodiplodia mahajangana]|uniref:Uncharacterized protein n=1 Tax=Lasiodiplodia mahajangana TaxID=1108764 RepID=A0ACC2JYV5_9PEZI|nr:hypothetical protein O1611_g1029 [Lasiodiplodia mahajangana]